ncbi:nucleotidyltransferase domain-containing protein [Mycolicibacterium fortuitum]|uniref:nucleotidyltransferase domain-containing protein n=1 Tax=Mycolicibacterium fortuitum TaxID=1766 RepID=UPI0026261AB0|nr:nucleotidyltransferase [Mycolicibacterium fortuitum]
MSDATLDKFVTSLVPPALDRKTVSERRGVLEDAAKKNTSCVGFVESGSWSHGTSIAGKSDVDYMAVLPGSARPMLPSTALSNMKDALDGAHWSITGLKISSPTVKVGFYQPPNFEIVPAYYARDQGDVSVFRIPGPGDEWVESVPAAHNTYVSDINDRLGKKLKPLVRLVKAWKYDQEVPVSSFYLEMRTARRMSDESTILYDIDLRSVFRALILGQMRDMNDPLGIVSRITATSSEANRRTALRAAEDASRHLEEAKVAQEAGDKSLYWRNMVAVFGYDYPWPVW